MIHYHGTPLSSSVNAAKVLARRHAMVSHATPHAITVVANVCQSFVIDNGAFTFYRTGRPANWPAYYSWAEQWLSHPACDWGLIPDDIGGNELSNDELVK